MCSARGVNSQQMNTHGMGAGGGEAFSVADDERARRIMRAMEIRGV